MYFENEKLDSMNPEAEAYITLAGAVAQEESRNMSENMQWAVTRNFEQGIFANYRAFMGYRCVDGELEIVPEQAEVVKQIFDLYLAGYTFAQIKKELEKQKIKTATGKESWDVTTIQKMLKNEKYKGDAVLQKSYTVDFLTKKRVMNQGEIQKFYIEDDHEAIIEPWIWECVQLEIERRKQYLEEHGTKSYSNNTENNSFASKIVCGECNKVFTRKGWRSSTGEMRKIWQCSERYKVKGVIGCANRHVEESTLEQAFVMAWNGILEKREYFMRKWKEQEKSADLLEVYRVKDFHKLIGVAMVAVEMDTDFMLRVMDYIKVFENGQVVVAFLDGTD